MRQRIRSEEVQDYLHEVGQRIRNAREKKGLKQSELAEKLGLQEASISYYETGHNEIPIGRLLEIAEITGTTVAWLAAGVSAEDAPAVTRTNSENTQERLGRLERALTGLAQQLSVAGIPFDTIWIPSNHDVHFASKNKKDE